MNRRHSILVLVVVLILAAVPAFANHGWSSYHWSRSCGTCPATIQIIDTTTVTNTNWPDHLAKSVFGDPSNPNTANRGGWNDSVVLDLSIVKGTSGKKCNAVAGKVVVCNNTYGRNGWLGLAQIWLSGGHISQGTTKVNDTYFAGGAYPNTEKRHVMCQEVGHDFGLGHTSENGTSQNTCMDYYANQSDSDWTSTGPNSHDFAQLETQHHWGTANAKVELFGDATANALRIPAFVEGIELEHPWQWGTPIEFGPDGTPVTFRLKLETNHNGHDEILTHTYPVRYEDNDREQKRDHK